MQTVTYKVPQGKLLRLKTEVKEKKLLSPQLSGDFFVMPSEGLGKLEEALDQFPVDHTDDLRELLDYVIERERITLSGFSCEDIVHVVRQLK